jgi:hypothetical protein
MTQNRASATRPKCERCGGTGLDPERMAFLPSVGYFGPASCSLCGASTTSGMIDWSKR